MQLKEYLKHHTVYLDGGMGTLLQQKGLKAGEASESWNLTHKEEITAIHKAYFDAGTNVVAANTFGANALKYSDGELEALIGAAVESAKRAREESDAPQQKWIALDIGPTGRLLCPFGDLDFEKAVTVFQKTVTLGVKYGVDLILIETMSDSLETKAAVLAAKAACSLPIFVSNAYSENGRLMTGATPQIMVAMLESLGVDAIGVNCSFGPKQLGSVVREYLKCASLPVLLKPNAGLPQMIDGENIYTVSPTEFATDVSALMREGVRLAGGCCGTTPDHIKALVEESKELSTPFTDKKSATIITSRTKAITFDKEPILIGNGIDPANDDICDALREGDTEALLDEAMAQQDEEVVVLRVNVSLEDTDEKELLSAAVGELQTMIDLPLLLDSADRAALESALRRYNGKPLVGPIADTAQLRELLPLIKAYGGVALVRTANEDGVPEAAQARVQIADEVCALAKELGIEKRNLLFTPAATASCDEAALFAVKLLCEKGYKTLLPISEQDAENGTFHRALACGLSAAVIDPYCEKTQRTYHDFLKQNT